MPNQHWLTTVPMAPMGEGGMLGPKDWIAAAFLRHAILNRSTYYSNYVSGTCDDFPSLIAPLEADKSNFKLTATGASRQSKSTTTAYILGEDGFINLDYDNDTQACGIHLSSLNQQRHAELLKFVDAKVRPNTSSGRIFMLKKTQGNFGLQSIGVAGLKLERENYLDEVVEDFDHIVHDLISDNPCGRLVILEGDPGTGKTYLIRSLIDASPTSLFVLIPPSLIEELTNPDFVPALVEMKNDQTDDEESARGPTVLIFEDADSILVERRANNMGGISACLNLSDGIIGSVLDLRIIASTNSKKVEMDEAILRDGRLCRYVNVGPLGNVQAHKVYERLTKAKIDPKNDPLTDKEHTLAEIYKKAREITKLKDEKGLPTHPARRPRQKRAGFRPPVGQY